MHYPKISPTFSRENSDSATETRFQGFRRRKQIGITLSVLVLPYLISFFVIFAHILPEDAYTEEGKFLGPTPNNWFPGRYSVSAETYYYTGREWPFLFYRPLLNVYIYKENLDDEERDREHREFEERKRIEVSKNKPKL